MIKKAKATKKPAKKKAAAKPAAVPSQAAVTLPTCRVDPAIIRMYSTDKTEEIEITERQAVALGIPQHRWR
tara:strand:- start:1178 stop:1390 length:213 start_codon:yes stop_codon:yes gene_type:complete